MYIIEHKHITNGRTQLLKLSGRHQLFISLFLILLLAVTRGHHFATIAHLPSASYAVFFLAGVYVSRSWIFPALLAEAAFLDYAAVTWGGVSSFCISPAYLMLIPAYGALWFTGRLFAIRYYHEHWRSLIPLLLLMTAGWFAAELMASGGFYFLSSRFAETTLTEFGGRLIKYGPGTLSSLTFYVGCAAIIHVIFISLKTLRQEHSRPV